MRRILPWLLLVATLAWCGFIWQFSLRDSAASSATSEGTLVSVNEALESIGLSLRLDHQTIRKAAHFAEFFVLGVLAAATLMAHGFGHACVIAPGVSFLVGCVDEILQTFSPGRGPSFLDVLLDTAGGICGSTVFFLSLVLYGHLRKKKKKSEINQKSA